MTQTLSLEGKVAVITGGARNIGKRVAAEMISRGAKVVIGDLLDAEGEATINEFNVSAGSKVAAYIHTDVTKYSDNKALFALAQEEFGGVDIAFLNAGIGTNANAMFLPLDDKVDNRMCDINTTAVVKGSKVAMLYMAKRGGGVIVNTASVAGFLCSPAVGIYAASKHGVIGWTRSNAIFEHVCGVRMNAVCPYWVETELAGDLGNGGDQDPFAKFVADSSRTKVETVVEAVLTLVEDKSRNAQTLLALPGDVIRPQEPIATYPEIADAKYQAMVPKYAQEAIVFYKKKLADALEREGI
ncbi:hypothetical protein BDB00DRAFT_877197 [Zychaea mexicana]|uniref:uncharacterized protein n=1 Tax=Zychaea mexicana TaxID=64656 RepID=UPI0022FEA15A|nr:uncharacterized protein BDB00DRAFT_877197 [Zychaea mexicana]KAI9488618.1 hypothetical protein BDB00DRAFT_877197 [Zychaea mexicana]